MRDPFYQATTCHEQEALLDYLPADEQLAGSHRQRSVKTGWSTNISRMYDKVIKLNQLLQIARIWVSRLED